MAGWPLGRAVWQRDHKQAPKGPCLPAHPPRGILVWWVGLGPPSSGPLTSPAPRQKLDLERETIELVHTEPTDVAQLPSRVPREAARYHFFLYKHTHEGDSLESVGEWPLQGPHAHGWAGAGLAANGGPAAGGEQRVPRACIAHPPPPQCSSTRCRGTSAASRNACCTPAARAGSWTPRSRTSGWRSPRRWASFSGPRPSWPRVSASRDGQSGGR